MFTGFSVGQPSYNKVYENLVFQDANIKAIFQFLAKESGVNIVVNPNVKAEVTLELHNISWQKVLEILLETYELQMINEGSYYKIMYQKDYRSSKKEVLTYERERKDLLETKTRIFSVNHGKADQIRKSITPALSHRGTVIVDGNTNSLIVTDIPEQFSKVEAILNELDIPTRQVKVSAKIVLVDHSFLRQAGVEWQAGKKTTASDGSYNNHQLRENAISSGDESGMQAWSQTNEVADKIGHFTWGIMSGDYNFQTALSAIISRNNGKIIDQPDVVTLDNNEAEIFSGEEIPLTMLDEAGNVVTKMFSVGTYLKVMPHITVNGRVLLDLEIERNAYTPTAGGYSILKRTASTTIIIGPNETAVIGGVTTKDIVKGSKGVPILMDLPLIGDLFRYRNEETRTNDLLIFINAEVL
jgi:type IV pilus assembly protein PilQ